MTQDEDLEILGSIVSATMATGDDEPGEDADREAEEAEGRARGRGAAPGASA